MYEKKSLTPSDLRSVLPRYTEKIIVTNKTLLDLLQQFAERKKSTTAQISLAWILAQKTWIVPIPGATRLYRLTEHNAAASMSFTKEELQKIEVVSALIK